MGCGASAGASYKKQVAPVAQTTSTVYHGTDLPVLFNCHSPGHSLKKRRPTLTKLREMHRMDHGEIAMQHPEFREDATQRLSLRSGKSCLNILEKRSVLVAVRVRPLNEKEQNLECSSCVQCQNSCSILLQNKPECRGNFTFDCVFDVDAQQQDVFDRTGRPLLHKALEGYNGCLIAYGQTGSGKTYTMQGGPSDDSGVIPLLCTELFRLIEERRSEQLISVSCSLLEIYNEQLNDLLAQGKPKDFQIHQDSSAGGRGMYVEGISEHTVTCTKAVLQLLAEGQARRMIGQTNMNEKSSRSHSVLTLHITVSDVGNVDCTTSTVAKLHLVDLAGSERQKSTGASGDRLREGAQINLSLSALGNVINALTEPTGKRKHIPYRDSKLTRLLQDSLGGNSYTALICNVSPATSNADETLSSLRFADRAKSIENAAIVNRDPSSSMNAALLEENKALKAELASLKAYVEILEENYE